MKQLNWYQIFGKSNIPDGRTVLPTDDIQIWLHCANIWDKTYTTLAEVLADTDTLLALISSNNAVDYMVRSTKWAVASALVPAMTSATTPSGVVSASSNLSTYYPYLAFDQVSGTQWIPNINSSTTGSGYIDYEFPSSVIITSFLVQGSGSCNFTCKLQGSNDGNTWTDLTSLLSVTSSNYSHTVYFSNSTSYRKYRLVVNKTTTGEWLRINTLQFYSTSIVTSATAMTYIGQNNYCANTLLADATWCEAIANSEYFESVLNVKVPTMTSNTTPEGECIASGVSYGDIWKAFRNTYTTSDDGNYWQSEANNPHVWIGYVFETPVTIKSYFQRRIYSTSNTRDIYTVHVQSSSDGNTWNNISDLITVNNSSANAKTSANFASNITPCRYYRIYEESGVTAGKLLTQVQFYGREDV